MSCSSMSINRRAFSSCRGKRCEQRSFSIRTRVMKSDAGVATAARGGAKRSASVFLGRTFCGGRFGCGVCGCGRRGRGGGGIGSDAGLNVLNDERDSPVGRCQRIFRDSESLVSIASDLSNLIVPDAALLHEAAGGVGAVGG